MSFIFNPIIDFIEDVVDFVVDVVNTIVDFVVDVVDTVFDVVGGLLGFDQDDPQDIEQFQVHNQPLFDDPDRSSLTEIILESVRNEEDLSANVLYASVFQSGKKNIRQFVNFIEDDNYFEDFPTVKAHVMIIDYDELDDVLTSIYSTPITIDTAKLGTLFVAPWIRYWLQENKSYNSSTGTFIHNDVQYNINVFSSTYNSSSNDYTLEVTNPISTTGIATLTTNGNVLSIAIQDGFYVANTTPHTHLLEGLGRGGGETTDITIPNEVLTYFTVPAKPTGLHYIVTFHKDSDPTTTLTWAYEVGAGTYTDLDDPDATFGTAGGTSLDILPAIPLRINNTNFNATTTTKSGQITALVDKIGLSAPDLISSVMEDVAAAGISDYNNKVDHVFLNFGVRLWDTSQIAITYCFRFVSNLYPGQGVTKGIYDAAADDKPYNNVQVEGSDYKYVFSFAYIEFAHTSLAAIDADSNSVENAIYYSNLSKFLSGAPGNNDLLATYYVSSGVGGYNVGYYCTTTAHVSAFLAQTLAQNSSYSSEAANWMQPTQRISFTGTLKNADDSTNSDAVIKPSLVYERINGTTLRLINRAAEETTSKQSMTYYQVVANGLNAYTIKSPKCMLRVVDAQTGKFKMVVFNLAEKYDLMIPFSFDLVRTSPNAHVTSLLLASAHISLYVAHYEVIEIPWWAKLLKIVGIVLFICAIITGNFKLAEFIVYIISQIIINAIVKEIIIGLIDKVSPEVAILLIAAYVYFSQGKADLSVFTNLFNFLGQTAQLVGNVLETYAYEELEDLRNEEERRQVLRDKEQDALHEAYQALFQNSDGVSLDLAKSSRQINISPIMPAQYLSNSVENFNIIGFGDFNYDSKINRIFEPEIMIT